MKKIILQIVSLNIVIIMLTGCMNISEKLSQNKTPNWYISSPSNSETFLYGAGEGTNVDEAKSNALNDMSARLVVSVGSVMNTKIKTNSNGGYSKDVLQDVTVEAKKIRFNNTEVEKIQENDNKVFLVMKVNRSKLYNSKYKEFLIEDARIDEKVKILRNNSVLEQIFALEDLKSEILSVKSKAFVLYAINNQFDYSKLYTKYDSYLDESDKLKASISISVVTNDKNKFFLDIISNKLNENNYKISQLNSDVQVKLTNKIRYSIARGWHIAKVTTTVAVSSNNKTLSSHIIQTTGRSSSNKTNALSGASKYFEREINKIGIKSILFKKR